MLKRSSKRLSFTQGKDKPMDLHPDKPITIAGSGDFELWAEKALRQRRLAKMDRDQAAKLSSLDGLHLEQRARRAEADADRIEAALMKYLEASRAGEKYKPNG